MMARFLWCAILALGCGAGPALAADAVGMAAAKRAMGWVDLTGPKYAGKLVMAEPSFSSLLVAVVGMLARDYGWPYFEKLRRNDVLLVQGNQQVSDMIKRGERAIAVGADASY